MGDFNIHLCNLNCHVDDLLGPELASTPHFEHTQRGGGIGRHLAGADLFEPSFNDPTARCPTFKAKDRDTIIDYIFVSPTLLVNVVFYNAKFSSFSDHNTVILELKKFVGLLGTLDENMGLTSIVTRDQGRRLKWSRVIPESFFENLCEKAKANIAICLDYTIPGLEVIRAFEGICGQVAADLTVTSKHRSNCGERWFDANCSKAHRELIYALKKTPRSREHIARARKCYKSSVLLRKMRLKERHGMN